MNDRNLRKLNRRALLEILLEQAKRIEELEVELEGTKEKLENKRVSISNVGSLAEASLKLSEIFKVADQAIEIQMKNVDELAKKEEKKYRRELRELKKKMLDDVEAKCKKRESEADKRLREVENKINKLNKNISEVKEKEIKAVKSVRRKGTIKRKIDNA